MIKYFLVFLLVACGSAEPVFNDADNITPTEVIEDETVSGSDDESLCKRVLDKRTRKLQKCRHKRRALKRRLIKTQEALHDAHLRLQVCEMRERNN